MNQDVKESGFFVHPSSIVDANVKIGNGTKIWHFCHIMGGVAIGRDCSLGQNVFVAKDVQIGDDVKIQNNVSLYEGLVLEDGVFCGPSCVFTNVKNPRSAVSRKNEYLKTLIKKHATIGANATIVCGNTVGKYAFVGAGSLVTHDVPDYALVYGVPAKQKGWVCECGEVLLVKKRASLCRRCNNRYKINGLKISRII